MAIIKKIKINSADPLDIGAKYDIDGNEIKTTYSTATNIENGTGQFSLQQVCTEEGKANLTNNKSGSTFGRGNTNYAEDGFVTGRSNILGVNGDDNAGKAGLVAGVENTVLAHSGFSTGVHNSIGQYADTSIAQGSYNTVNAQYSSAVGRNNTVGGNAEETHIIGDFNNISGQYNIAIGHNLNNSKDSATLLGRYNNPTTTLDNPNFIIANGTSSNRSNAVEIDGSTTAINTNLRLNGELQISGYYGKRIYIYSNVPPTGLLASIDGNVDINGDLTIGTDDKFKFNSQYNQLVMGTDTSGSTFENVIALGKDCKVYAPGAVAIGKNNEVRAWNSYALGYGLFIPPTAPEGCTVVGKFNYCDPIGQYAEENDKLFKVGNGTDDGHRKNAFVVLTDGRAQVQSAPTAEDDVVRLLELNNATTLATTAEIEALVL